MKWLGSITDSMYTNLSKLCEIVTDREAWCAAAYGVTRVSHKLVTKPTTNNREKKIILILRDKEAFANIQLTLMIKAHIQLVFVVQLLTHF